MKKKKTFLLASNIYASIGGIELGGFYALCILPVIWREQNW